MARTCTVCNHNNVQEIDKLLLSGGTYRNIAERFHLSLAALSRHKESHIPESLLKANDIKGMVEANDSLATLQRVKTTAFELLDKAIEAADTKVYGSPSLYLREIREQVKLWAELEGKLATQPQVNILMNPEYINFRTAMLYALDPYPEAKAAVVKAIRG